MVSLMRRLPATFLMVALIAIFVVFAGVAVARLTLPVHHPLAPLSPAIVVTPVSPAK